MLRTVWAVVGVAALAAGCAGGTGGDVSPGAGGGACPPWTSPEEPGDVGQDRPDLDVFTVAAMDTESGQVVVLPADGPQTWVLDVCTNTWQRRADRPAGTGQMTPLPVYDVGADVVLAFDIHDPAGSPVWVYSVEQDTWTERPSGGGTGPLPSGEAELSPDKVISGFFFGGAAVDRQEGILYVHQRGELYSYDLAGDRWEVVRVEGERPPSDAPYALLAFDEGQRVLVLAVLGWEGDMPELPPAQTWLFDVAAGTWSQAPQAPPEIGVGWGQLGGEMTYDPASGRIVAIGDGRVAVFDAGTGEWSLAPTEDWGVEQWDASGLRWPRPVGPQSRSNAWLVADPLNGRVLVLGGSSWGENEADGVPEVPGLRGWWERGSEVVTYDVAANTWFEIVPPAG